jgi:hypothetical protein
VFGGKCGPAGVAVSVGVGVWPTGVAVGVGVGVWPTGVAVGVGVCPTGVAVGVGVAAAVGVAVAVAVSVGDGVTVAEAVGEAVGEAVAVGAAQPEKPTWFVSIVTAPLRARPLPDTLAPVVRVMLVRARMLPTNTVPVPMVAELPTCQNTLQPTPPLVTRIDELLAVVSVLPI